jgi:pyrimidine deaminase RibD-like protein
MQNIFRELLHQAIDLSKKCNASESAYSVGAIITDKECNLISSGYSRELGPKFHAEEVAILKAQDQKIELNDFIIFSSLEPCSSRASSPQSCSSLIIESGIKTVVFACREPNHFVDCLGSEILQSQGIRVIEYPDLANEVLVVNKHLGHPLTS